MKKVFGIMITMLGIGTAVVSLILKIKGQISIIGGVDGPTTVFIAGKVEGIWAVIGILAGVILFAVGVALLARKK